MSVFHVDAKNYLLSAQVAEEGGGGGGGQRGGDSGRTFSVGLHMQGLRPVL